MHSPGETDQRDSRKPAQRLGDAKTCQDYSDLWLILNAQLPHKRLPPLQSWNCPLLLILFGILWGSPQVRGPIRYPLKVVLRFSRVPIGPIHVLSNILVVGESNCQTGSLHVRTLPLTNWDLRFAVVSVTCQSAWRLLATEELSPAQDHKTNCNFQQEQAGKCQLTPEKTTPIWILRIHLNTHPQVPRCAKSWKRLKSFWKILSTYNTAFECLLQMWPLHFEQNEMTAISGSTLTRSAKRHHSICNDHLSGAARQILFNHGNVTKVSPLSRFRRLTAAGTRLLIERCAEWCINGSHVNAGSRSFPVHVFGFEVFRSTLHRVSGFKVPSIRTRPKWGSCNDIHGVLQKPGDVWSLSATLSAIFG